MSKEVTLLGEVGLKYPITQDQDLHTRFTEWADRAFEVKHNPFVSEELLLESMESILQRFTAQLRTVEKRVKYGQPGGASSQEYMCRCTSTC